MTVIAYSRKVIACDSLWSDGQTPAAYKTKIVKFKTGALFGHAGAADGRALEQALSNVRKETDLPSAKRLRDELVASGEQEALFILPDGKAFTVYGGPENSNDCGICPVTVSYWAIGCGAEFALGALHHGASAREAVQSACFHSVFCKPPVHMLTLGKTLKPANRR